MAPSTTVTIHVPRELRAYCRNASELVVSAATVSAALNELDRNYPALYRGICDETGRLRRHINLFVNSSHIRERQALETSLESGDVITILPAVSGG